MTAIVERANHYRLAATWTVAASPAAAFDALKDIAGYPRWWRQIAEVRAIDDRHAWVRARSLLPYSLRIVLEPTVTDRAAGVLQVSISGDLEGWARWRIDPVATGARLRYRQVVVTTRPVLRALAPVARAAFIANHAWMMRSGERGLRALLAPRV